MTLFCLEGGSRPSHQHHKKGLGGYGVVQLFPLAFTCSAAETSWLAVDLLRLITIIFPLRRARGSLATAAIVLAHFLQQTSQRWMREALGFT